MYVNSPGSYTCFSLSDDNILWEQNKRNVWGCGDKSKVKAYRNLILYKQWFNHRLNFEIKPSESNKNFCLPDLIFTPCSPGKPLGKLTVNTVKKVYIIC